MRRRTSGLPGDESAEVETMAKTNAAKLFERYYGGDKARRGLFTALAAWCRPTRVLYPGGFIHVTASFEFCDVTYVDTDRKAKRFFSVPDQVRALVERDKAYREPSRVRFLGESYEGPLDLEDGGFDLLLSLYAGFISKPCKRYLAQGGLLVVNNSHADAGLAAVDPDYELVAVVLGRGDRLRVSEDALDTYLIPKRGAAPNEVELRERGRGIAYTKPAVAYVFRRV